MIVVPVLMIMGLSGICIFLFILSRPLNTDPAPTAELLLISPPLDTPTMDKLDRTFESESGTSEIIIGSFVQISGTDQEGLRLRAGPGTGYNQLFLGMESEVFEVKDGPVASDGYAWWYLIAPYDKKRNGWAASDYLVRINSEALGIEN